MSAEKQLQELKNFVFQNWPLESYNKSTVDFITTKMGLDSGLIQSLELEVGHIPDVADITNQLHTAELDYRVCAAELKRCKTKIEELEAQLQITKDALIDATGR